MPLAKSPFPALALAAALLAAAPGGAATLEVTGPPGATVAVNGHELGRLPLARPLELEPGTYVVQSTLEGHIAFSQTVILDRTDAWVRVQVRLDRLSRGTAWRSSVLFAGLGQFYTGNRTRGWIYAGAEAGGLLVALVSELQRSNHRRDHLQLVQDYSEEINQEDIVRLREAADVAYADMQDAADRRDLGLLVAVGAVAVSVLDALITFPDVAVGPGPVPPTTGARVPSAPDHDLTGVHAAVRLAF